MKQFHRTTRRPRGLALSPTLNYTLFSLLAVLLAVAGFIFTRKLIDFPVYYSAGQSLLQGRSDLYAADFALGRVMDYRYPPFFLVVFIPLWLAPYPLAAYLWYVINAALAGVSVSCINRLIVDPDSPVSPVRAWVLTFFAVGQYYVMILHYGNAHFLAINLMFISLCLLARRREVIAALLFAAAVTIKVTPILILPYFALIRRWRAFALTLGFIVLLNLAPAAYFGLTRNVELLSEWYRHVVVQQEFHELNGPINLSLKGQLRRYVTQVSYHERVDGDVDYRQVNVAELSTDRADTVWEVSSVVLYCGGLILLWLRSGKVLLTSGTGYAAGVGLMIMMMLLIGPLTSKIYFIAMMWPVVVLARLGWQSLLIRIGLLFVAVVNLVLPLLPGRSIQRLLLVVGVDFYLACLLLLLCAYGLTALPSRNAEPRMQVLQGATSP